MSNAGRAQDYLMQIVSAGYGFDIPQIQDALVKTNYRSAEAAVEYLLNQQATNNKNTNNTNNTNSNMVFIDIPPKVYKNAGVKVGIQIWRIDNSKVKHWPKDRYGEFYGSNSYIVLNTMENNNGKKYELFFWLGSQTSQVEANTAAYSVMELADCLTDKPTIYREVQGNESIKFFKLFRKISVFLGGIDNDFRSVRPKEYKPRLLHLMRPFKKCVQVRQVAVSSDSLNNSDAFVLDCGLKVFQFNGSKATAWMKRKANAVVDELQASRHGKVKVTLIIDGLDDYGNPLIDEFWSYFGGKPKQIKVKGENNFDLKMSLNNTRKLSLHVLSNNGGTNRVYNSKLESNNAYILDTGDSLFVWIGKDTGQSIRKKGISYWIKYLRDEGRDINIPIALVTESREPEEFLMTIKVLPKQTDDEQKTESVIGTKDNIIASLNKRLMDMEKQISVYKNELQNTKNENTVLTKTVTALRAKIHALNGTNNKLSNELNETQSMLAQIRGDNEELTVLKNRFQDECVEITRKYNELKSEYEKQKRQLLLNKDYTKWDSDDIIQWICSIENGRYKKYDKQFIISIAIKQENIIGEHLMDIDKSDLHRFGITDFGDKKRVLNHIQNLQSQNIHKNGNNDKDIEGIHATVYH